jgi:hypothetical protein
LGHSSLERRGHRRFPIETEIRYRITNKRGIRVSRLGTTINISSRGVLFTTNESLAPGSAVTISLNWPVLLDGHCRLQFVAAGFVVRAEPGQAVAAFRQYEFRTASTESTGLKLAGLENYLSNT